VKEAPSRWATGETKIAKLGENIGIARFVRLNVGDVARPKRWREPSTRTGLAINVRLQAHLLKLSGRSLGGRSPVWH